MSVVFTRARRRRSRWRSPRRSAAGVVGRRGGLSTLLLLCFQEAIICFISSSVRGYRSLSAAAAPTHAWVGRGEWNTGEVDAPQGDWLEAEGRPTQPQTHNNQKQQTNTFNNLKQHPRSSRRRCRRPCRRRRSVRALGTPNPTLQTQMTK